MMFLSSLLGANLTPTGVVFLLCALGGTLFFFLRLFMILVVGVGAEDMDIGADGDVSAVEAGADTDAAFKLFNLNSVTAFIMMFGWAGLSAHIEFGYGTFVSLLIATLVGVISMAIAAWILVKLKSLQSSGDIFDINSAIGKRAEVYQRIPSGGVGKVQVDLDGTLREIDAESVDEGEVASFTFVTITGVRSSNRVLVKSISE